MKKAIIITVTLFSLFSAVFADGTRVLDSETKVISAYKRGITDQVQEQMLTIRMMDTNSSEFENSEIVVTPLDSRDSDYPVFYWVLGGNIYHSVSVTFLFEPMWKDGLSSSGKYIPYTLKLSHVSSKVGNSVLVCDRPSVSLPISFMGYEFYYADSVDYPENPITIVPGANGSATVSYDMSTNYTRVKQNGNSVSYSGNVCSFWNRMGLATIHLMINSNAIPTNVTGAAQLPDGMYFSTVTVSITSGS